ncbi:MAG: polyprenol monophosphomannose synthase, partial [Microgenomates group bacterium]
MTKGKTAVVIIPTYNEAATIGEMIEYLFEKTFPSIKDWQMKLLIVDDTSPDGTYKVVQQKQKQYKDLHLSLSKEKAGIGGAYVRGFKYAMKELKADVVIEMDGDFQHPPETIPVMLAEIDKGADYVLGSRKIKGGSNPKGWDFKRVFFSEFGGLTARFILFFPFKNFWKITDPTTGLKASRVKGFVDRLDMDHLYSRSFAYKLEFLFKMMALGAKVKEIPLQFGLRESGASKIEPQTAKEILITVIKLRWHEPFVQKFLKFGTVGFIGYLVNAIGLAVVFN